MKKVSVEEAKKMVGTEFTYVYEDGDEIKAYIKAFDPEIGLTCYTLETETRDGWYDLGADEDGTWCVIGCDFDCDQHIIDAYEQYLPSIKDSGKCFADDAPWPFNGCAF